MKTHFIKSHRLGSLCGLPETACAGRTRDRSKVTCARCLASDYMAVHFVRRGSAHSACGRCSWGFIYGTARADKVTCRECRRRMTAKEMGIDNPVPSVAIADKEESP
jgi:hypothetical protein